ncbi:MAG: ptsI [Parachlamydiales bacterium]|nr:ptsI [Parachlamydiales bacterium]
MEKNEEIVLRGLPISRGIGIGLPLFFSNTDDNIPETNVSKHCIESEVERYRQALHLSRQDVERLQHLSLNDGPPEIVNILGTHLEMLQDPLMTSVMEDKIRAICKNSESIVLGVIDEYKKRFRNIKDGYFQERVRDIIDVSRRVLGHLRPVQSMRLCSVPTNSIVLAHDLVPSDTVEASAGQIGAFVTASGGITSHAAIIARAKGIPYVAHVDIKLFRRFDAGMVIVDGTQGIVIVNPTSQTLKKYQSLKKGQLQNFRLMQSATHLKGETIDGYQVRIFANLEELREIDFAIRHGASGVGLMRTEYLLFSRKRFPTEDEQTAIYRKMAQRLEGRPLVIRIYDVGGDKKFDFEPASPDAHYFAALGNEPNPALGCRAIRFMLRFPQLLDAQLRACLRASQYGDVHILIPMVSDVSELRQVRARVAKISSEMRRKGMKVARSIPIGCMIEVPSSALLCDALAKEADFLSVGTNDLVQYVLAADRNNILTSNIYSPAHPSILRLIRMIIASSSRFKKPLLLCGESAADPVMIPLLLGLGIREFSVASRNIPLVKHIIRKWRILDACQLAEQALEYYCADDLKHFLEERISSLNG